MLRSKRPGRSSAGSRSAARLVAPITRMLAGAATGRSSWRWCGSHALTRSTARRLQPHRQWRLLLEGLELYQQFVDHPGDALTVTWARPAHPADGVELLDEADRTTLTPSVLAEGPEERTDLPVGLSVEHRLERRRRHEEEGHAGLGGHGLRHVGLTGARRALEEDGLAWHATHLLGERAVREEEVEGLRDLFDEDVRSAHVVEAHVELVRPVEDVR